jgi:hypothetical protein
VAQSTQNRRAKTTDKKRLREMRLDSIQGRAFFALHNGFAGSLFVVALRFGLAGAVATNKQRQ